MKNETSVKFAKPDGTSFIIQQTGEWRFLKNGFLGFGKADGRLSYVDNVMGDGGEIKNVRLTRVDRTIKTAYVMPYNNDNARRALTKFFTPRLAYKIYVSYMGITRWAEGVLYKMQLSETLDDELLLNATMTFAFANPLWKSVDDFGEDIASVTEKWAFPWLCAINTIGNPVGIYNFDKKVNLFNDGDVLTFPQVIIYAKGYVENPSVIINGNFVKVNDILYEGDEIVMNLGDLPPTVTKNGNNFLGHCDKQSQFNLMYLDVGDNVLSFDADNGSDNLAVTVYYNKMYTVI